MAAFAAYLGASRRGARPPRRRALVLASVVGHLGLLVVVAAVGVHPAPAALSQPAPVLVRLWAPARLPRSTSSPPPPRKVRHAPPPRLAQPVLAPPVETPPPPDETEAEAPAEVGPPEAPAGASEGTPEALPAPEDLFEVREVARPPSVIKRVTPDYPRGARRERVEGTVVLRVIVGIDGAVERSRTRVVRSVPALDGAATAAIELWRFSPAIGHSGRPVRVIIEVPFQFYLR